MVYQIKTFYIVIKLKLNPIKSYIKSIGWEDYDTAIGIRIDEIDRININRKN